MKTLAMIKMEKNFRALEKGYPRRPYEAFDIDRLIKRLQEELNELIDARIKKNYWDMLFELADLSNMVDYIFEQVTQKIEGKQ